jgi:hypothetical protein
VTTTLARSRNVAAKPQRNCGSAQSILGLKTFGLTQYIDVCQRWRQLVSKNGDVISHV